MNNKKRLLVLNNPYRLTIDNPLACEIGLNESIMLLQLDYLISISTAEPHEGSYWTYQSIAKLREDYFSFWGKNTIIRTLKSLVGKNLIKVGNFNKRSADRTKWYALNPEGINKLKSVKITEESIPISGKQKSIYPKWVNEVPKMGKALPYTTPETSNIKDKEIQEQEHEPYKSTIPEPSKRNPIKEIVSKQESLSIDIENFFDVFLKDAFNDEQRAIMRNSRKSIVNAVGKIQVKDNASFVEKTNAKLERYQPKIRMAGLPFKRLELVNA